VTTVEPVDLAELDTKGVMRDLDDDQARLLADSGLVRVNREGGGWRIRVAGKVGAVRAGDLDVQVRTKVGIVRLLFFLGYARDPRFRPEDVAAEPAAGIWPALAESLIRQVERVFAGGVLQGYQTVDDALPVLRGRVRFADQFARRPVVPLPLEIRFDDFTTDIAENRLLRTAIHRMMVVPRLPVAARDRLVRLDGRLTGVRILPPASPLPGWQPNRLNARYAPALRLADLILRGQSVEAGPGGAMMAAFVVNMATVFENFVGAAITEALRAHSGRTVEQYPTYLDVDDTIPIRPDVVYLVGDRPVAVFDAKYKLEHPTSGFPNADTYQMLAYCAALNVPAGWLVYAKGTSPPGRKRVRGLPIEINHHALNISADPDKILQDVQALVRGAVP
jgi:5-methylcytosine-specific restriction enzyme subunit McrC